jgi:rhodanese-related sulfurtransferase
LRLSFSMQCITVLALALACGLMFNLVTPQGIGLIPAELKRPLWRSADLKQGWKLYQEGALFFDARDPGDYKMGQIKKAINLAPEEWERMWPMFKKVALSAETVVVYGNYFSRRPAEIVANRLRRVGLETVYVLEAGLEEWVKAGHPVRMPRRGKRS